MTELRWEEPSPSNSSQRHTDTETFRVACMENPGKWLVVKEGFHNQRPRFTVGNPDWECSYRTVGRSATGRRIIRTYIRYNPKGEK